MRSASLGMYGSGAARDANDRLWAALAEDLREAGVTDVPDRLDRDRPLEALWSDPDLLFAQTCGYPWMTQWRGRLRYLATPCYTAPGCAGPSYRSRVVVRRDDPRAALGDYRGATVAVNDRASNSGMSLLRILVAPLARDGRFFGDCVVTGAHRASMAAVASGRADIAAIDTVTFALAERAQPDLAEALRTLAWTEASPGLPYVTSAGTDRRTVRLLRRALGRFLADERHGETRDALLLAGIEQMPTARYQRILTCERRAIRLGYPELA